MFSIAALLTQWVPTIVHAISTGKATLDTLRNDFNQGTPSLTPEQKTAAWAAIIQHDEVKAAIHHAAAGEDIHGNPLPTLVEQPPANAQVGTQLREMAPLVAGPFAGGVAVATPQGPVDEEADALAPGTTGEPQVEAGDVQEAPVAVMSSEHPDARPNRTAMRLMN
jgi:hypothetical protein